MNQNTDMKDSMPKVLAISSGGGHWVQLLRLRPALVGCEVVFATVHTGYSQQVSGFEFWKIPDSNRWKKVSLAKCAIATFWIVWRIRPDVVITTGAAPGYFAARVGKLLGARVVWIDSVANAEKLSMSGQKAGKFADLWLTQWPHLVRSVGPKCFGSVL